MDVKRLNDCLKRKKYFVIAAAIIVAVAIVWLYLSSSAVERKTAKARQLMDKGIKAYKAKDTFTALSSLQKAIDLTANGVNDTVYFEASVYNALLYENAGKGEVSYRLLKPLKFIEVKNSLSSLFYLRVMARLAADKEKDYKKALQLVQRDIDLCRKNHPEDPSLLYIDQANLCELHYMKGDRQKAWQAVRAFESLKTLDKYHDLCYSEVYYVHSALLIDDGQLDSAYHYASLGFAHATKYNYSPTQIINLRLKCRIDSMRNDLAAYLKNRHQLDNINQQMKSAEIMAQAELVREQGKIDRLQSDNARKQLFNVLLMALLVLVAIFFVFMVYSLRKKARDKQRMAELEKERLDSEIQRKKMENQLLMFKQQDTEKKLDEAYKNNVNMSAILATQEEGKQGGESLTAMENNLRLHHPDFMERLKNAYPHLTDNDMRVLGFMHMGYSSKVIAAALNITMSSLTTTRYRLKKKLNLAGNADLKGFVDAF